MRTRLTDDTIQVDWDHVAQLSGYSNANCAKVRFGKQVDYTVAFSYSASRGLTDSHLGQIKKAIGFTAPAGSASTTPVKSRGKKEVGTGTNKTPSKIKKATTPRKPKTKGEVLEEENDVKKHDDSDGGKLIQGLTIAITNAPFITNTD